MTTELLKEKHLCGYHLGNYVEYVKEYGDSYAFTAYCVSEVVYEDMLFVERWTGENRDWIPVELDCMVAIVLAALKEPQ